MNILTLDLGEYTGWAMWLDGELFHGVQRFPTERDESAGMKFLRFRGWLISTMETAGVKFDTIYHERPHHRGGAATAAGAGYVAILQVFCEDNGIPFKGIHSGTLKKFVTGKGNSNKDDMIAVANRIFRLNVTDDNEADALCLLYFAGKELGVA